MNYRKSILLSVVAVAFAAPGLSFATSLWHPAKGDSGGEFRQDHFQSTVTRAEVMQELQAARKDGSLLSTSELERGLTVPAKNAEPGKTRAQVRQELITMSAEDKQRTRELYIGS
ncbi:MAG: DUF4148 domain-containing protein [Burkholderiales bacterium]